MVEDANLVRRSLNGDQRAFEMLVDRYQQPIFNIALRICRDRDDAADLAQNVFVKAYEQLARFDPTYKFFSWIYRIAINESLNFVNRQKGMQQLDEEQPSSDHAPDDLVLRQEENSHLYMAMDSLTTDYRLVISLFHFLDLSYREISEILSIPEKRVKSRLFTARTLLRESLEKKGVSHA